MLAHGIKAFICQCKLVFEMAEIVDLIHFLAKYLSYAWITKMQELAVGSMSAEMES